MCVCLVVPRATAVLASGRGDDWRRPPFAAHRSRQPGSVQAHQSESEGGPDGVCRGAPPRAAVHQRRALSDVDCSSEQVAMRRDDVSSASTEGGGATDASQLRSARLRRHAKSFALDEQEEADLPGGASRRGAAFAVDRCVYQIREGGHLTMNDTA